MKKKSFNDRYGQTRAVLEGRKTMWRETVPDGTPLGNWAETARRARFKAGETVAVARSYADIIEQDDWFGDDRYDGIRFRTSLSDKGTYNKNRVRAELMPDRLRITGVRIERLRDISDGDCMREGIYEGDSGVTVWIAGCEYDYPCFQYDDHDKFASPREAFAALADKLYGKGTWERNPYVFVYESELIKQGTA